MAKKTETTAGDQLAEELAELGLSDFLQKAIDRDDMDVEVLTTGLTRLDRALHSTKLGMPRGRRVEVFSKDPEVGKTSLSLQIGVEWQRHGMRIAIVDIEDTVTNDYLVEVGFQLAPEDPNMYPVYVAKGFDPKTNKVLTAEEISDSIGLMSTKFDLVIIDSIGALAKRSDLEKDLNDSSSPGGVAKILAGHCRKYMHTRATTIWINQALPQIGVFSPMGVKYKTGGGHAIPFFASIRLELRLAETLKKGDDDPYGAVIDVFTFKNKVSPPKRHIKLTYLDGEGFSPLWDTMQEAIAKKIITKSGSWFSIGEERVGQGEMNVYNLLKTSPDMVEKIKKALGNEAAVEE